MPGSGEVDRELMRSRRRLTNVATTVSSSLTGFTQVPVPLQPPPDQPTKVEPDAATAVRVASDPVV